MAHRAGINAGVLEWRAWGREQNWEREMCNLI